MAATTRILIIENGIGDAVTKTSNISVTITVTGATGTISGGAVSLRDPTQSSYTQIGTMNGVSVTADTSTTAFTWSGDVPWSSSGGGTVYVQHASFTVAGQSTSSRTQSFTLTQIPLPATITFSDFTAGTASAIGISRASTSHRVTITTTLTETVNQDTYTIATNSTASSVNYTYSLDIFNSGYLTSRSSTKAIIDVVTTDSGGNVIGTRQYPATVNYPDNPPTIEVFSLTPTYASNPPGQDYVNAEELTGKFYNNGLTNLAVNFSVTPHNTYLSKVTMTGDLGNHLIFDNSTAPPLPPGSTIGRTVYVRNLYGKTGVNYVKILFEDVRGQTSVGLGQLDLYVASAPSLSNATITRGTYSSGTFTENEEGTAIRYQAHLASETTFGILTFYKNGTQVYTSQYSTGTVTYYFTSVDPTVNTNLQVDVHNWLSNASYTYIAPLSKPDFNYNPTLHGIAFGKQASESNLVDSDWPIKTSGVMTAQYVDVLHNTANMPQTRYRFSDKDNAICGNEYVAFASGGGGRFYFREHSANSSGTMLSNYEQYRLPAPDGNRSSNATYDILTTKNDGQLTLTYTSNTYVSSTAFNRLYVYRRGNILIVRGNLQITTAMPSSNSAYTIGSISNWNGAYEVDLTVPAQDGSGVLLVIITTAGNINIYNTSGNTIAANAFCRFNVAVPVS